VREKCRSGAGVNRWLPETGGGHIFQDWDGGGITEDVPKSAMGGAIDGVLAEYALFRERGLVRVPANLSFEEGATLPCAGLTAWHAMQSGNLTSGRSVLTLGTGGVSLFRPTVRPRKRQQGHRHNRQRGQDGANWQGWAPAMC